MERPSALPVARAAFSAIRRVPARLLLCYHWQARAGGRRTIIAREQGNTMQITLKAEDGHAFGAYEAKPAGKARGGIVLIQEIFGVNAHIRSVSDRYAADGYHVIAPAIFDRAEPGVELGYSKPDVDRGVALRRDISLDDMLLDIAACVAALKASGKVAIIGYCLGGSLAWLAAARLPGLSAAVGYYGGMIAGSLGDKPAVPVMLHFGKEDGGIPAADVEKIKAASDPAKVQVFLYAGAGHAFNRDGTPVYHAEAAKLALERTQAFLAKHVG
jgi:carboxymethylenebutenolidase